MFEKREGKNMANMLDYLKWRGDLSLEQDGLNEIDNLILTRFSYLPFSKLMKEGEKLKIRTVYERYEISNIKRDSFLLKDDIPFFRAVANSNRFGNLVILKYENKISLKLEEQFAAVTILLPKDTAFVSFCGTDDTIVGWKENFNMSFKSHLPAQKDAVCYLNSIGEHYAGNIIVGGHSKGGNLAVYAAAFCKPEVQKRIVTVYSDDGPGFGDDIIESKEYKQIVDRVVSYVPQSSVIGRLLLHEEKYYVVKSTQVGILQHDPFSWQLEGKEFIKVQELTNGSNVTEKTIKEWLENVEPERREIFIDTLYDILVATNAKRVGDLGTNWIRTASTLLKKYKGIDEESKKLINQTLEALKKSARNQILESFSQSKKKEKGKKKKIGILSK